MREKGFRAGYHPTPSDLGTLRVLDKKKRTYIDRHGNTYSNRAVQEARNGYLSIEDARDLRKDMDWPDELLSFRKRAELPISFPTLARQWEKKHNHVPGTAWNSKKFRNDLKTLVKKATRATEDENFYPDIDDYLDDTFDMSYEDLTYYH